MGEAVVGVVGARVRAAFKGEVGFVVLTFHLPIPILFPSGFSTPHPLPSHLHTLSIPGGLGSGRGCVHHIVVEIRRRTRDLGELIAFGVTEAVTSCDIDHLVASSTVPLKYQIYLFTLSE